MASEPSLSPSPAGLLKLEEQLTCAVCFDIYTNPKTLPCLHSFCEACIERFLQDKEGETYYLSCPTCRRRTELPGGGSGAFPVAFHINNLKEVHSLMKNAALRLNPQQPSICKDHEKPLELFCETCDSVICCDCTVRTHKDHEYDLVSASYTKHCQELKHFLNPVKEKVEALKKILSALAEREGEIRERGEGVLGEIHEMVEEMMNALRQSERKLSEEARRVTDAKLEVLSGQAKSAQMSLSILEDIVGYVEQNLKTGTPQQVLRSKKQMMERMSEVTTQINVEELEPKEKADFVLSKDIKSLHHIGDIILGPTALQQCKVKIDHFERLPRNEISFSLSVKAPGLSLVSVPPFHLKCNLIPHDKGDKPIHTTVAATSTHPGVYRIHCNPSTRGTHTVKVQLGNVELKDTSLIIPFNPYLNNITPVRTITELKCPWGVAVSNDGHVIVTENKGNCVTILDNEGQKVKSIGGNGGSGNVKFSSPHGVAITPDNFIYVSDRHKIQIISMDGNCIASVGEKGDRPLQFNNPNGIAISPITGQVYIAECDNHRVQVLNPDLTFSYSFGKKGSAIGQFHSPQGIAIDSQGLVYVADGANHRIQKFSPGGRFLAQFGGKGSGPPSGIATDTAATGLVYVSEWSNHCVSAFTSDGVFVNSFERKGIKLFYPEGLVFSKEGFLYVCDYNNQMYVY